MGVSSSMSGLVILYALKAHKYDETANIDNGIKDQKLSESREVTSITRMIKTFM